MQAEITLENVIWNIKHHRRCMWQGMAYTPSTPPGDIHHYSSPHLPHVPGQQWRSHHLDKPNTWDPQTAELMRWGRINSWMKNKVLAIPRPRAVSFMQNSRPEVCWCTARLLLHWVSQTEPWTVGDKGHGGFHAGALPTSHPLSSLELLILAVKPPYHISVPLYMC